MSYRPYLESSALRQIGGLPEQAFDMLVTLLARDLRRPVRPGIQRADRSSATAGRGRG